MNNQTLGSYPEIRPFESGSLCMRDIQIINTELVVIGEVEQL